MTVDFELAGQSFTALNGGPVFEFNEAIDFYWDRLTAGGDPKAQQCGWLKDRFGLSWQVVPRGLAAMLEDSGSPEAQRAMEAILRMKKIDIEELHRAYQNSA